MSKGQPSPGGLRSPRKRALEIGTAPSGFAENATGPYSPSVGVPASHVAAGKYDDKVTGVPDPGAPVANPFKLGS